MKELAPDQIPDSWSEIAEVYEQSFESMTGQLAGKALEMLAIQPGEQVLDVATGPGVFARGAAAAGAEVLATDFAAGMIDRLDARIADEGISSISTAVMDGQNLACEDACFDVSASIVGVIFFPDIGRGVSELRRVLRPGGRCAIACWGGMETFQMFGYLRRAVEQAVPDFEMPTTTPVWARLSGAGSLNQHLESAGFSSVNIETIIAKQELDSPEMYWQRFTSSAPPLQKLFASLGQQNTELVGECFVELIMADTKDGLPTLTAEACIGVGIA